MSVFGTLKYHRKKKYITEKILKTGIAISSKWRKSLGEQETSSSPLGDPRAQHSSRLILAF